MAVTSFQVKRCEPELVVPAKPTPRELKKLSDIDNLQGLRHHLPLIWIYKNNSGGNNNVAGKDPVEVIREALGRVLVYYYPLAGRLIEDRDGKLMVDCNAQGMLLVEANADVKLQQLGHPIVPPFSFLDEVLYNVPGSDAIGNGCPLLLMQVTRFVCGGFIVGVRLTHSVWDGCGVIQFLNAVAEMAQGAQHPSVPPVWQRELLDARNPPRVTCIHNEFQLGISDIADQLKQLYESDIVQCSFTFTPNQIMTLRKHLPPHLATTCTQFELLTACLWKCRTLALNLDPQEVVQVSCTFSGLAKKHGLNLPLGYYGNVIATPSVASEAGVLSEKPFAYAVELLKKATSMASGEYIRSVADLLVTKRPTSKVKGNFMVSDTRNLKFEELDFGWGYPEYAGVAISFPFFSFYMKYKNNGEDLIVVLISLPRVAIDKFQQELKKMTDNNHGRQI